MTVRRYMVWDDTLGTAAARPYLRLITCDNIVIADQPFAAGEAYDIAPDAFAPEEDDDTGDSLSISYTVDTTVTPKTVAAASVSRFTLAEREDIARRKINRLLAEASTFAMRQDAKLTEAELAAWLTYCDNVRALLTDPGFPDTLVYPTKPAIAGTDTVNLAIRSYRRGNVLAAVTQASGIPTGGLIEWAENSNGIYVRLADGLQLCFSIKKATFVSGASLLLGWTFPAAFADAEEIWVNGFMSTTNPSGTTDGLAIGDMEGCQVLGTARSTTGANFQVRSVPYTFVSGDEVWLNIMAVGRWV